jgi:hypothetical protein
MAAPRPAAGRLPDDPEKAARKARIAANGGMGALVVAMAASVQQEQALFKSRTEPQ